MLLDMSKILQLTPMQFRHTDTQQYRICFILNCPFKCQIIFQIELNLLYNPVIHFHFSLDPHNPLVNKLIRIKHHLSCNIFTINRRYSYKTISVINSLKSILTAITVGSRLWKVAMSMLMFWADSFNTSSRDAPPIRVERKTGN